MSQAKTPVAKTKTPADILTELGVSNSAPVPEAKAPIAAVEFPYGYETNPSKLKYPQDPRSAHTQLKREIARAVGRMNGDPTRLAVFEEHLEVALNYARARCDWQIDQKNAVAETARRREAAREASTQAAHKLRARNARKAAVEATKTADALEAVAHG